MFQDAFLLNKADMVRKSRARLRGISIRAAERHMQQVYEQKKMKDAKYVGYHSKEAVQSRDSPRWASVVPVKGIQLNVISRLDTSMLFLLVFAVEFCFRL